MLVCWIMASIVFLMMAYCFKYRALWQEVGIKIQRNIWAEKDIDDFLHYLRHEYFVFCLCFSLNFFDYSQIYWVWVASHDNVSHKFADTVIMVCNQASRILSLVLL